jgi:hypothetical protein
MPTKGERRSAHMRRTRPTSPSTTAPSLKVTSCPALSDYTPKGDLFTYSKPRVWSDTVPNALFDIYPEGKRFAVIPPADSTEEKPGSVHATFLLNFFDEVRRRVPLGK